MAVDMNIVRALVNRKPSRIFPVKEELPEWWRFLYEERAAIREYDGMLSRQEAQTKAYTEILYKMRENDRN